MLYNEKNEFIDEVRFKNWSEFFISSSKKINMSPNQLKQLIDYLDNGATVLVENDGDFIIQEISHILERLAQLENYEEIRGSSYADSFPLLKKCSFCNALEDIYNTKETGSLFVKIYDYYELVGSYKIQIIKIKNKLYMLSTDNTQVEIEKLKEKSWFNDPLFAILRMDYLGGILDANNQFLNLTGYSIDELKEIYLQDIITEFENYHPSINTLEDFFHNIFSNQPVSSDYKIQIKTKDENLIWFTCSSQRLSENVVQSICFDITKK